MPTKNNSPEILPVTGHLEEMRRRIIFVLAYLAAGMLGGLLFARELVRLLQMSAAASAAVPGLILTKPTDIVSVYFKLALYAGIVAAAPAAFYNIWKYVRPALPEGAGISPAPWFAAAASLFCAGTVFSYKILLPSAYGFLMDISSQVAAPMITLDSYISFALSIIALGGLIFEMPLAAALLTRLRIITPSLLRSRRKEAFFALCVAAAVITPTTDIFNMVLFVFPMAALYEISVAVSSLTSRLSIKNIEGDAYAE